MDSESGDSPFADDRHTLYCGWVMGALMHDGLDFTPVTKDGNYTDLLTIELGEHRITLAIPYPPDDWTLTP